MTRLYDLADQLLQCSPWRWMEEERLIRIEHPFTGESGYVSIMGAIGQHRCLAMYLGEEAVSRFFLMQSDDPLDQQIPEADRLALLLESRQLQVSFVRRAELRSDELAEIKKLGRKYRGDGWPVFRSYRPGRAPGPLDAGEAEWLAVGIEQFLAVAPTLEADLLADSRFVEGEPEILTRSCHEGAWRSGWTPLEGREFEWPTPAPAPELLDGVKRLGALTDVECMFQLVVSPIGRSRTEAVFPYVAVTADVRSGLILGMDCLSVEKQSHSQLIASAPDVFLRQWIKAGVRPASIRVSSIYTYSILEIAASELNTPMRRGVRLPVIDRIMDEFPL